jgi:RNA polymerase sigma factor (sigma-70 family)
MDASGVIAGSAPHGSVGLPCSTGTAKTRRFEQLIMPHLDSAHNLARWLVHNDSDAEDIVQEACLRAYKYLDGFEGGDPTGWLLAIVRNTTFSWMKLKRRREAQTDCAAVDEEVLDCEAPAIGGGSQALSKDPETLLIESREWMRLNKLIQQLSAKHREMVVLRDIEDLSYREIAAIVGVPIGTVMSRLCRARRLLQERWARAQPSEEREREISGVGRCSTHLRATVAALASTSPSKVARW